MTHKKAVIGAAGVLALGVGATAVAAPNGDGPLGGVFGPDRQERKAEQAKDLAKELNLPEARVRKAIERVGEKRRAEHQAERAKELAKRLGVSESDAAKALAKGREALRKEFQANRGQNNGMPPFRGAHQAFLKAVAGELHKSTAEVKKALEDIRKDKLDAALAEAVKDGRLTQKQADEIKKRAAQGPMRMHFRGRRGAPGFGPPGGPGGPPPGGPPPGGHNRRGDNFLPGPPPGDGDGGDLPPPPGVPG